MGHLLNKALLYQIQILGNQGFFINNKEKRFYYVYSSE